MTFLKGQPSWNKGKRIGETHPQMGFQKGNRLGDNLKTKSTQFKKGVHVSSLTEFPKGFKSLFGFKKGFTPWNKGLKGWRTGKDNPTWKPPELRRKSEKKHLDGQYRDWMFQVKNRDNWQCRIANEDCKGRLEAHHILNWVDYPELRFIINNGISLCHAHHPRGRAKEKQMIPTLQELLSQVH